MEPSHFTWHVPFTSAVYRSNRGESCNSSSQRADYYTSMLRSTSRVAKGLVRGKSCPDQYTPTIPYLLVLINIVLEKKTNKQTDRET